MQAVKDLDLKAIYSRSLKSAQDLASNTTDINLYSEDSGAGRSYTDLLNRSDISAVIIGYVKPDRDRAYYNFGKSNMINSLPILVQPDFIRQALLAGKHVLSEKPIAKDVATARELLSWYQNNIDTSKVFWAVGENFRYMTKFLFAAEQVRQMGQVRNFRVNVHSLVKQDNKYYCTLPDPHLLFSSANLGTYANQIH